MINFIIYENQKKLVEQYKEIIKKLVSTTNKKYNIKTITKFNKNDLSMIEGKKIYLLSLEDNDKFGIKIAYEIRTSKDWISPIIILSSKKNKSYYSKIRMLDFIIKDENLQSNLTESLKIALEIQEENTSFNFMYNNVYYQIPLNDICFFEKSLNHNYVNIITKNNSYKLKESITKLNEKFKTIPYFYKTHQSYIINIQRIKKIDFTNNIIYFTNEKFTLLSREKKKELKDLLIKQNT